MIIFKIMDENIKKLVSSSKWGFVPGLSYKSKMTRGKWVVTLDGDICFDSYYWIYSDRLSEDDWIIHLLTKDWFDFNDFMPIYMQACLNAGVEVISIKINY